MSAPFSIGARVRVTDYLLERLIVVECKRYIGRVGVLERKYTPLGSRKERHVVRWLKRGNRGKEFEGTFYAEDLELAP